MIYEVVLTTKRGSEFNIAPMGIRFLEDRYLLISPFKTSDTYEFLKATGEAVVNFVDNVEIIAKSVILDPVFPWDSAEVVDGWVLKDAYMYMEVKVCSILEGKNKANFKAKVLLERVRRAPCIFNRARFLVIEGAILVSRLGIYPEKKITDFFRNKERIVFKTGGDKEKRAWVYLRDFLRSEGLL